MVEQDDWEKSKSLSRRVEEVRREGVLDKGLVRSPPLKEGNVTRKVGE